VDSLEAYSEALASARPTPGGGSAATIVGALGAALVAMVARITRESPKHSARANDAASIVVRADSLRAELLSNRGTDEAAFGAVIDVQALPRATDAEKAERGARLQSALANAAEVPLRSAELARDVLALALEAIELGNKHLASDAGCAAEFGHAALAAAAYNVRANHAWLHDKSLVESNEARLHSLEHDGATLLARVRELGSPAAT
jgi:formiminotetrahydrofolate cyclodeaminase